MTDIDWHLPQSLTLYSCLTPLSRSLTLAAADPVVEAVAMAGREDDESPVLVVAHGVVEHGFDRGSRG